MFRKYYSLASSDFESYISMIYFLLNVGEVVPYVRSLIK